MAGSDFLQSLADDLAQREQQHLRRELHAWLPEGVWLHPSGQDTPQDAASHPPLLNLASNDYLGLSQHPALKQAMADAAQTHGTGSGASRLVTGTHPTHQACEQAFAQSKAPAPGKGLGSHSADSGASGGNTSGGGGATSGGSGLLLPSGYMANLAVLTALAGPGDLIAMDKLVHASLIDAAQASGATVRRHPHLNLQRLDQLLAAHGPQARRRFIVTDSVFSMDGDCADLPALCELADKHDAVLVVDDAHGTGILGDTGSGLAEADGVQGRVDITVATCSKALGCQGGVVVAPKPVIDTLVNRARALIYTTGVSPALAATAQTALHLAQSQVKERRHLQQMANDLRQQLTDRGWQLPPTRHATPIIPLIVGDNANALALANHLRAHHILAVAIRPPTVAPGAARVRITLRADLCIEHITELLTALDAWTNR